MIRNCLFLFILVLFFNCGSEEKKSLKPRDYQPQNIEVNFNGSSFNELRERIDNNYIIKQARTYSKLNKLDSLLLLLHNFNSDQPATISFDGIGSMHPSFMLIIQADSTVFQGDSLADFSSETISSNKTTYDKLTIGDIEIFRLEHESNQFYGNNLEDLLQLTNAAVRSKKDLNIDKITTNDNSIVLRSIPDSSLKLLPWLPKDSVIISNLADKIVLNFKNEQGATIFNGIAQNEVVEKNTFSVLRYSSPQENSFSKIVPANIESVYSYTFNDIDIISKNLESLAIIDSLNGLSNEFKSVLEISKLTLDNKHGLILKTINAESTLDYFSNKSLFETYRDIEIFNVDTNIGLSNFLNPLVGKHSYTYLVNVDEFILLSDDLELLKECISSYQNESSLFYSETYKGLMKNMSDESSVFLYFNPEGLNHIYNESFDERQELDIDPNSASAIQLIMDNGFAHINGVFGQTGNFVTTNIISEDLQLNIDAEILSNPQFISNHVSGSMDIVFQDVNNVIYLYDNRGMLLFKRKLDGAIQGNIQQIDAFGNGRKQMVFATSKTVYAISRAGKDLGNFPVKFRDDITQPLSVFDYDNNKRYRLLVTQGNDLLMLDKNGKRVRGFKFNGTGDDISSQPKHIRIKNKDYIVFKKGDRLLILSRTGSVRVRLNEKFAFSDNDIYSYNEAFVFTDSSGVLISIDPNGKKSSSRLSVNEDHYLTSTTRTLVVLNDNILSIRSDEIELDFGNYTQPKIFIENNKIFVSLTDLQTNKVYLFDSQAESIDNFPVYGNSSIDMGNFDTDTNIELVVKSGTTGILVYELK